MKVLIVDQFSEMGGAQRCLADVAPAFLQAGWDLRVVLPGPGPLAEFFARLAVPVHFVACGPYRPGTRSVRDIFRFAADFRAAGAVIARLAAGTDLMYVNGPRLLPAAAHACRGVPLVFHSHSRVRGRYVVSLIGRGLRRSGARVIASSRFVAEPWLRYRRPEDIAVIYNGTAEIPCRPRPAPTRRPWTIGVIGRISPEKGQLEFVRAARMIAAASGLQAQFVIHGAPLWSPPAYLDSVRAAGAGLDIGYIGWDEPVASTLHALDLLVVPSPSDESATRVIPEAFSAGAPVVAFPSGGIPEIVRHGETGLLADAVTVEALAVAIRDATERAPELPAIAARARLQWEEAFTLQRYREGVMGVLVAAAGRINTAKSSAASRTTTAAAPSTGP